MQRKVTAVAAEPFDQHRGVFDFFAHVVQQHRAQAESYLLQGQLAQAIEQLQYAQRETDGNFYEQSVVDARLRELRIMQADEDKLRKEGG